MGKWTLPIPIKIWYSASPDWHTPNADNDIIEHGRFNFRMEAKDGSMGFNYEGAYTLDDDRKVEITFTKMENGILITENFEPEAQNSIEMQKQGWQAILDNFKKKTEERT